MPRPASLLLVIAILGLASAPQPAARAQTPSSRLSPPLLTGTPAHAGMSAERLARIDTLVENAIRDQRIPGAVALVARRGAIVHLRAYGMADNTAGRPLQTDTIFRIASQTKAITSTAMMMLWEEGRFQLDDPISKWIPEFKDAGVLKTYDEAAGTWTTEPANKPITIRHLLTHTSGIGYGVIDGDPRFKKIYAKVGITDLFTTERITIAESVRKLAALPLHHHPGEKFTYSEGLDVAGYLIELISGKPLDVFLRERLFEPLGMKDTAFYLPEEKAGRLVAVQTLQNGKWVRYPVTFYDPDYPIKGAKTFFSGGAGLCSTVRDYAQFLQMYLNGGELNGTRFLSRTTIATMMADQTHGTWGGDEKFHGLAFAVVAPQGVAKGGLGSIGTFEWGGYFNTQYFADPQEGTIGLLFKQTQGDSGDPTGTAFRMLVNAAIDD
jgi:CubicO group peptidase (beta-lactamase class C family)